MPLFSAPATRSFPVRVSCSHSGPGGSLSRALSPGLSRGRQSWCTTTTAETWRTTIYHMAGPPQLLYLLLSHGVLYKLLLPAPIYHLYIKSMSHTLHLYRILPSFYKPSLLHNNPFPLLSRHFVCCLPAPVEPNRQPRHGSPKPESCHVQPGECRALSPASMRRRPFGSDSACDSTSLNQNQRQSRSALIYKPRSSTPCPARLIRTLRRFLRAQL